ncbi:MAG: 1-acyl-sn-glycerol-3-phosphate acyltransferase [Firmicutes bacterium]|nr:1-acyl-sn-glycerol-3-phosphate acyltransferase [Bacillota bacterium]
MVKVISKGLLWLYGRPIVTGKENIPSSGRVIVVANHTSLLDGFLLAAFWPRKITFLAAAYLFELPVIGAFLRAVGAILLPKSFGTAGIKKASL